MKIWSILVVLSFVLVVRTNHLVNLPIYSTGVDDRGVPLPLGDLDMHYQAYYIASGGIVDNTPLPPRSLPAPAYVVATPPTAPVSSGVRWISFAPDINTIMPSRIYYYVHNFYLPENIDLWSIVIHMNVTVDDRLTNVWLNGRDTFIPNTASLRRYVTFEINGQNHIYQYGMNQFVFVVSNNVTSATGISILMMYAVAELTTLEPEHCSAFDVYDPAMTDTYTNLADVGLEGIILNYEGKIILTDEDLLTKYNETNMLHIQSVVGHAYGEPVCATIIDCASAGHAKIFATITNNRTTQSQTFHLEEVCSNPGIFFGCVDTAFSSMATPLPPPEFPNVGWIEGEFADPLVVSYNGESYDPMFLVCLSQPHWTFDTISTLMIQDSIMRNQHKLLKLYEKISKVRQLLFENDDQISCDELAMELNLAPTALHSYHFLDCLEHSQANAAGFAVKTGPIAIVG